MIGIGFKKNGQFEQNITRGLIAPVGLLLFLLVGCQPQPSPITLNSSGVEPSLSNKELGEVLDGLFADRRRVRQQRLVVPEAAKAKTEQLDIYLKRLSVTGPTVTPYRLSKKNDRLAYWLNARAAWSIKLAMVENFPRKLNPTKLIDRPFPLDGRTMSLRMIDQELVEVGGWRAVVAAPGISMRRARLPEKPFTSADVHGRLAKRLSVFLDDERRFRISFKRKKVLVPAALWQFREHLTSSYKKQSGTEDPTFVTVLLSHVEGSPHRRLQDAIGFGAAEAPDRNIISVDTDARQ